MVVCPAFTALVPHVGGPILPPCAVTVLIGSMPAARIGDMNTCAGGPGVVSMGSPTVLIMNMPAARITDVAGHGGVITTGFPQVLIGP